MWLRGKSKSKPRSKSTRGYLTRTSLLACSFWFCSFLVGCKTRSVFCQPTQSIAKGDHRIVFSASRQDLLRPSQTYFEARVLGVEFTTGSIFPLVPGDEEADGGLRAQSGSTDLVILFTKSVRARQPTFGASGGEVSNSQALAQLPFTWPLDPCSPVLTTDRSNGCGSKFKSQGYAGFSLWFHLPRCHFGSLFLSHSQMGRNSGLLFNRLASRGVAVAPWHPPTGAPGHLWAGQRLGRWLRFLVNFVGGLPR